MSGKTTGIQSFCSFYIRNATVSKGIFKKLKDIELFIKACTVINGTLGWDIKGNGDMSECLDLDPDIRFYN